MHSAKTFFIKSYGCQMNHYDSDRMHDILSSHGMAKTDDQKQADVVILNTCHIREKATEKIFSELGRLRAEKNKMQVEAGRHKIIVIVGCVSQAIGEEVFSRSSFVDAVVGPTAYHQLPQVIDAHFQDLEKKSLKLDFTADDKFDTVSKTPFSKSEISAFVAVQEGCDKFCTFCVVPYTRGPEFSRPVEQIYQEVQKHVALGAKEIVLLGQNVNAFHGKDQSDQVCDLARLIKEIALIPELARIRYTTSHPCDMSPELIAIHGTEEKLMPMLNLPVQSGSNNILGLMNRKYKAEEYLSIIEKLRHARKDMIFSSDFIVGFPGESEDDFEATMQLVTDVKFESQSFSFKYSTRPGTPAALKDQVPEAIKSERLVRLQNLLEEQRQDFNNKMLGRTVSILLDNKNSKRENQISGRTEFGQIALLDLATIDILHNQFPAIVNAKVTKVNNNSLLCEKI